MTKLKWKEFSEYDKACAFRDKVDGQTEWCMHKGKRYWLVWYTQKVRTKND